MLHQCERKQLALRPCIFLHGSETRCVFTRLFMCTCSVDDVDFVVESMFGLEPWCRCSYGPFAYRISPNLLFNQQQQQGGADDDTVC